MNKPNTTPSITLLTPEGNITLENLEESYLEMFDQDIAMLEEAFKLGLPKEDESFNMGWS